jgi:hypothetical protein
MVINLICSGAAKTQLATHLRKASENDQHELVLFMFLLAPDFYGVKRPFSSPIIFLISFQVIKNE